MRSVMVVLLAVLAYFLFWPVAIDPVAWRAPTDSGYVYFSEASSQFGSRKKDKIHKAHHARSRDLLN